MSGAELLLGFHGGRREWGEVCAEGLRAQLSPWAGSSGPTLHQQLKQCLLTGRLHFILPLLMGVGLPKALVRLSVPGDAFSFQKSQSSNGQGLLGAFLCLA